MGRCGCTPPSTSAKRPRLLSTLSAPSSTLCRQTTSTSSTRSSGSKPTPTLWPTAAQARRRSSRPSRSQRRWPTRPPQRGRARSRAAGSTARRIPLPESLSSTRSTSCTCPPRPSSPPTSTGTGRATASPLGRARGSSGWTWCTGPSTSRPWPRSPASHVTPPSCSAGPSTRFSRRTGGRLELQGPSSLQSWLWTTRSGPSAAGTSRNSSRATSRFDEAEHPEFPELRAPARSRLA
mmetsp:Transcript_34548/g.81397  ORF Transcript_34548/g.81397 Transcript_34548/m.81397 type:complete len:236 (-) Transcript_34548:160-867(-)